MYNCRLRKAISLQSGHFPWPACFAPSTAGSKLNYAPQIHSRSQIASRLPFLPPTASPSSCLKRCFTSQEVRYQHRRHPRWDSSEILKAKPLISVGALHRIKTGLFLAITVCVVGGTLFYIAYLEEVPISGRRRFNCFSEDSVIDAGSRAYILTLLKYRGAILPDWDTRAIHAQRVMSRLIPASGLSDLPWKVHVIDSSEKNAFVIPGGHVFVFTGLLELTQNDDRLAAVLGHEIAHHVAQHPAEHLSSALLLILPRYLLRIFDRLGVTGGFGTYLGDIALDIGIRRPSSRTQEAEADHIGLMIMAKSCYEPTAAVEIWKRLEEDDRKLERVTPQWLSTHPANATRIVQLTALLGAAEKEKEKSGCAGTVGFVDGFYDALQVAYR